MRVGLRALMSTLSHRPALRSDASRLAWSCLVACVVVVSGLGAGCEREGRYELFTISELSASRLDAGRRVQLRGSGFPVGREVEVVLDGTLRGPLRARAHVHHALRGRTETPERVEVVVTEADVERIGGRGTFEGSLELVVHGAAVDGLETRVVGTLSDVVLDVVPGETRRIGATAHEGRDLGALLGLGFVRSARAASGAGELDGEELDGEQLDDEEAEGLDDAGSVLDAARDGSAGLTIAEVSGDGLAARLGLASAGLAPGSRVVSLDGMRPLAPSELRVAAGARSCSLVVVRQGGRPEELVVDLDAALGRRRSTSFRYDQLAAIILVGALLFGAWPAPSRPSPPASRAGSPASSAPGSSALGSSALGRGARPFASLVTGLFGLLVALTGSVLASGSAASFGWWLGLALFCRVAAALAAERPDATRAERARELLVVAGAGLGMAVAIGVFVIASGAESSAAWFPLWSPLGWPLVRSAFGPFALLLLLASAGGAPRAIAAPEERRARLLRGLDDLGLALAASVFVRVSIADPSSLDVGVRAMALSVTVALYCGLLRARRWSADASPTLRLGSVVALVAATVAGAAAWLDLAPEPATERAVAEVVLVAVGLVFVRVASLRAVTDGSGPAPRVGAAS